MPSAVRIALPMLLAALPLTAASCTKDAPSPRVTARTFASSAGVPQKGFPNWTEQALYVLTNRARNDPAAELAATCTSCAGQTYPVARPLAYSVKGSRAARFHATTLLKAGSGLMHDSVCKIVSNIDALYPDQCDGDPSCACEGGVVNCRCQGAKPYCSCANGACTSTWGRIGLFGYSAQGENAAAAKSDPKATIKQWINSSGHRNNMLKTSHRSLGVGYYGGSGGCWGHFNVQVFGGGTLTTRLPGGVHYPRVGGTSTTFEFLTNYYDLGNAPTLTTVNIGGSCTALQLERGTADQGSYRATSTLPTGCHRYYFVFRDAAGQLQTYPESGSYGVGVGSGSGSCAFYDATARPGLGQGCGVCQVAADCDDNNPCTTDTCNNDACAYAPVTGCCVADGQCDDGDVCTDDRCGLGTNACTSSPVSGCCKVDSACDDGDLCTEDSCDLKTHRCKADPIAGCCTKDSACDDGEQCTLDRCDLTSHRCKADPIAGCCTKDGDCDDGARCTQDSCNAARRCEHQPLDGCCTDVADCVDQNPCTEDRCDTTTGRCENAPIAACCRDDAACDDGDACTIDTCDAQSRRCTHAPHPSCGPGDGGPADGAKTDGPGTGGPGNNRRAMKLDGSCAVGGGDQPPMPPLTLMLALALLLSAARRRRS